MVDCADATAVPSVRSPAAWAARVARLGVLACVVVTPLLMNPHSVRSFEEDKAFLLRFLAWVIGAALVAVWVARGVPEGGWRRLGRAAGSPPALAGWVLLAATGVATLRSIAPGISLWGAYVRCQGLATWLAWGAVFLAVLWLVSGRARAQQVVSAMLLASWPCSLYAIAQFLGWFGLAPLAQAGATGRVVSTAGNPIFLAGHLILTIPLTLSRLLRAAGQLRVAGRCSAESRRAVLWARVTAYAVLAGAQGLAVAVTRSRGPVLALAGGLCFFVMVLALHRGRRKVVIAVAAAVALVGVGLVAWNVVGARVPEKGRPMWLGRMGEMFHPRGTGRARLEYWTGAMRWIGSQPERLWCGWGPDTTMLAYTPFHSPALTHLEGPRAYLDRLHNQTLDSLVTTGAGGAVAWLAACLLLVRGLLGHLGLIRSRPQGRAFWAWVAGCGAAGLIAPWLVERSFRTAGLCLPLGLAAGVGLYLVWLAVTGKPTALKPPARAGAPCDLLPAALLAAGMTHFLEVQLCLATVTSRLYWWVLLALGAAIMSAGSEGGQARPGREGDTPDARDSGRLVPGDSAMAMGTMLAMVVMLFGLFRSSLVWQSQVGLLAAMVGGTWLAGLCAWLGRRKEGGGAGAVVRFTVATVGGVGLFAAVYVPWSSWRPTESRRLVDFALQQSHVVTLLYAAVLLAVGAWAWRGGGQAAGRKAGGARRDGRAWAAVLAGMALAIVAGVYTSLNPARADCLARQAAFYRRVGAWPAAAVLYAEASRLAPYQGEYQAARGAVLTERALAMKAGAKADETMAEALACLSAGRSVLDVRRYRALARAHSAWATRSGSRVPRRGRLTCADACYRQAVDLAPGRVTIRTEWARMWLDAGEPARARAIAEESRRVDADWGPTRMLLGRIYVETGQRADALAELEATTEAEDVPAEVWHEKAELLGLLGEVASAITSARRAVQADRRQWRHRERLARLLTRAGQRIEALAEARRARELAPLPDRACLDDLIRELQRASTTQP